MLKASPVTPVLINLMLKTSEGRDSMASLRGLFQCLELHMCSACLLLFLWRYIFVKSLPPTSLYPPSRLICLSSALKACYLCCPMEKLVSFRSHSYFGSPPLGFLWYADPPDATKVFPIRSLKGWREEELHPSPCWAFTLVNTHGCPPLW